MPVTRKITIPFFILAQLLFWANASMAATYAHGLYAEEKDGFSIRVPVDWERTLTNGNQADTHLFVSPDKQVAIGVSVYGKGGSQTKSALLDLFQAEGLAGSKQLQEQTTALNGRGGLLRAYALPGDGDPIIAVAVAISAKPRGYVIWYMIPGSLFEAREPEAGSILDTFLIRPDAVPTKTAPHTPPTTKAPGQVPDFFGSVPSAPAEHAGTAKTTPPNATPPAATQAEPVPDCFGRTSTPPAARAAQKSPAPKPAPQVSSKSSGTLDPSRFPLFIDYSLNNIPPALAACPAAGKLPMPEHDSVEESVGADGYTIRSYRRNGTVVAAERLKKGTLKSVSLWKPDRKGRVYVEFWSGGTVSNVDYYEGMYKQGISRFWDTDGTLAQIVTYRDNKQDGPPKIVWLRNKDHTLRSVEHRTKGKRHGLLRTYHRNGQLEEESHWDNGTMMRQKLFYISGEIRAELRHSNGKSVGAFYNKDGSIQTKYE